MAVERGQNFGRRYCCSAALPDLDSGSKVGDDCGLQERAGAQFARRLVTATARGFSSTSPASCSERCREIRGYRIARSDDVVNLTRCCRNTVDGRFAGNGKRHSSFTEREEQSVSLQLARLLEQHCIEIEIDRRAESRFEFAPIRLEHGRAAEREEAPVFGIDDDRNTALVGGLDRALNDRQREHTLVVVLQHQCIGSRNRSDGGIAYALHFGSNEIEIFFFVKAEQLLSAGDDACFGRGRAVDRDEPIGAGANGCERSA